MQAQQVAPAQVRRGFVEIAEGQVHFREAGQRTEGSIPLVMLHASPSSSKSLEPLLRVLGRNRHVIAPDTLGNGDSVGPARHDVDLAYFADAHMRVLDALGLKRFDLYGTHTGANIACEIAIARPQSVRALILDGVSLYEPDEQEDMVKNYVPDVKIDLNGSQFNLLWHFVRDVYLFWPWYRRDAAHRRNIGLPSADELHDKVIEVLKAARTFHVSYRAALAYRKEDRLPLIKVPTLMACAENDMLLAYFERIRALLPQAQFDTTPGTGTPAAAEATAAVFSKFHASRLDL